MRDILEGLFDKQPVDPTEAARRAMRQPLRKRFYRDASVGPESETGFPILLDQRSVRTPARNLLAAPNITLATALVAEWQAQGDVVDPAKMPLTRLANTIIDGVSANAAPVAAEVGKYVESDLLFYRAERPEGLVAAQVRHWDPLIAWAHEAFGARFMLSAGVVFVAQPEPALAAVQAAIPAEPWRLGAVHAITTLTGSALIALAIAHGRLTADEAWDAAHVDEDWNMSQWGRDELALQRRAFRWEEMRAAAAVLSLLQ